MKKIVSILLLFIVFNINAQTKKNAKQFTSINSIGTVWGSNQNVVCFETINGIIYKNWNFGVGVSFDGYGSQSTPVFLDVRKSITKNNAVFMYVDGGINMPWRTNNFPKKNSWDNMDAYQLKNTFYGELGVGYKKLIANNTFFVASVGYSYKTFSYNQNQYYWNIMGSGYDWVAYDFYYKRVALRLGIQF